jgi:hypothetical protein
MFIPFIFFSILYCKEFFPIFFYIWKVNYKKLTRQKPGQGTVDALEYQAESIFLFIILIL